MQHCNSVARYFLGCIAAANESNVNGVSATARAVSLLEWQYRGFRGRRARRRRRHQKVRKADTASYGYDSHYYVREYYTFHHKKRERQSIRLFHVIVMFRSCSRVPFSKKSLPLQLSLTFLPTYTCKVRKNLHLQRMRWSTCNFYLNDPSSVYKIWYL